MTGRVTRRFLVTGRVQGVGFRHFVATSAGLLGLRGTVANRMDGSVEVVAHGDGAQLDELKRRLQRGPRFASVTNVESFEISNEIPLPTGFAIVS